MLLRINSDQSRRFVSRITPQKGIKSNRFAIRIALYPIFTSFHQRSIFVAKFALLGTLDKIADEFSKRQEYNIIIFRK